MQGRYGLFASGKIEERRTMVAEKYFTEGKKVEDIAVELGVTTATIYNDIRAIREEYYESRLAKMNTWFNKQLATLDFIEEQALEGWFRSIGKNVKKTTKKDAASNVLETVEAEEVLIGDPRFLTQIQEVVAKRNKMLGLDAPDVLLVDTMESKLVKLIVEGRVSYDMLVAESGQEVANRFFNLAGKRIPQLIEGEIISKDDDEE